MALPLRVIQSVRPHASPGVISGAAVVAAVFAATPFLLPEVSGRLGVSVGSTGLLSAFQVAAFALASFLAGRLFRPRRRLHYGGLALVAVACFGGALAPNLALLLATRVISGFGLGTLTWVAWADATRFPRGIGEVAAVAPITAAVASPPLAWLMERGGYPTAFTALGALALLAMIPRVDFGDLPRVGRQVSGSRSNRWLLAALFTLSLGGSAVFVFSAATGTTVVGLSPITVSWALSINAIAGVAGTRIVATRGRAGAWMIGTALSGLVLGTLGIPWVFFAAMAVWGFAYWVAVPAIFALLHERSLTPNERIGDAQALMAGGRVFGPIVGGLVVGVGRYDRLSWVGAGVMVMSAIMVMTVEFVRWRQHSGAIYP
jgi:predicted MFS family arabinose efflux permease